MLKIYDTYNDNHIKLGLLHRTVFQATSRAKEERSQFKNNLGYRLHLRAYLEI